MRVLISRAIGYLWFYPVAIALFRVHVTLMNLQGSASEPKRSNTCKACEESQNLRVDA